MHERDDEAERREVEDALRPTLGRRMLFMGLGGFLFLVALAGCGQNSDASPVALHVDSAGVEVVTSSASSEPPFALDSVPELRLGGPDVSGPEQFGLVQGVSVASDGSIWVADRQSSEIRVFESDGTFRTTVGGRGDGPGEFQLIRLLGQSGDSIAVVDDRGGRISWFGLNGGLLSEDVIARDQSSAPVVYGVGPDGRLGGVIQRIVSVNDVQPGDAVDDGVVDFVVWETPAEPPHVFASAQTSKWLWTGTAQVPIPFTTNASLAVGEQLVGVGGTHAEVRYYSRSGLERIARVDREPRNVDSGMRSEYSRFIRDVYPEAQQDAFLEVLDHPLVPDAAPAYRRVLIDTEGLVWAQHFTADRRVHGAWDVYGVSGAFLGVVQNPPGLWVQAITENAVVGIWLDELDVSHLQRHRLVRP